MSLAEQYRYVLVSGQGTPGNNPQWLGWNAGTCCLFQDGPLPDDVQFLLAAIDSAEQSLLSGFSLRLDRGRVFSMGMSNGGMMSERLGCEQPAVFRGIASVTGITVQPPGGLDGLAACDAAFSSATANETQPQPLSVLLIHGTADATVPWNGTGASWPWFPSVPDNTEAWTRRLQCSASSQQTLSVGDYSNAVWGCPQSSQVELVTVAGGAHVWYQSAEFDSGSYILQAFTRAALLLCPTTGMGAAAALRA